MASGMKFDFLANSNSLGYNPHALSDCDSSAAEAAEAAEAVWKAAFNGSIGCVGGTKDDR